MRRNKADEVDQTHEGDHGRRHDRSEQHTQDAHAVHTHAQASGHMAAVLQRVIIPAIEDEVDRAHEPHHEHEAHLTPRCTGKIAELPEHDLCELNIVGEVLDDGRSAREKGRERHANQDDAFGAQQAQTRECEHDQARYHGTREGEESGHAHVHTGTRTGDSGDHHKDRERGAKACAL